MEFGRVDVERKEEASLVSSELEASQCSRDWPLSGVAALGLTVSGLPQVL